MKKEKRTHLVFIIQMVMLWVGAILALIVLLSPFFATLTPEDQQIVDACEIRHREICAPGAFCVDTCGIMQYASRAFDALFPLPLLLIPWMFWGLWFCTSKLEPINTQRGWPG